MPDKIDFIGLAKDLRSGALVKPEYDKFSASDNYHYSSNNYISEEVSLEQGKDLMRQQAKKLKEDTERDLAETGYTPENIKEFKKSEDFWHGIFETTKKGINKLIDIQFPEIGYGLRIGATTPDAPKVENKTSQPRSIQEISQEYINASKKKKLLERVKANDIVVQMDGSLGSLKEELPYMEDITILDRIWNSAAINQNSLGDKKFSINWTPNTEEEFDFWEKQGKTDRSKVGVYQYYYTKIKDKDGKDIDVLAKAEFNNLDQLKKAGNVFLNNFGPAPVKTGFWREFSAGLGNAKSGLERSLLNYAEGASTFGTDVLKNLNPQTALVGNNPELTKGLRKLQKFSDNYRAYNDLNNYEPSETGGTMAWLGAGVGQGAASLAQFAVMNAAGGNIGALVSPKLSAIGKLDNLTTFGAGAVMNFGEAYESALNAGLDKSTASKIGMLTGAINGIIESAVGTNQLTNWLSGGGSRILAERVLVDLGGDVSETSMKKLLNTWQRQTSGKIAQIMNTPILGNAIEEGIEEFSQTMTQKSIENLYDAFFADDKEIGKGKFGTQAFSKESIMEALEAGFFGAILGGSMGTVKLGADSYNKYVKKKTSDDSPILEYLAQGNKSQIVAMVETLHSRGIINDNQREFYTQKINHLAELVSKEEGRFAGLEETYGEKAAANVKKQAYDIINSIAQLDIKLEELSKKEQTEDTLKETKKTLRKRDFYNKYLTEEFTPREDGKVNAVEYDNYLNQDDVLQNKWQRFNIETDITSLESSIEKYRNRVERNQETLDNTKAKKGKAAKEIQKEIDVINFLIKLDESKLKNLQNIQQRYVDEYNEITSKKYQLDLEKKQEEQEAQDTADKTEEETSAPVDIQPGVEGNSEVELDELEKPTSQLEELLQQKEEILVELENNPDLDQETIAELEQTIESIDAEINSLDADIQLTQIDYQNQVTELAEKLATFADLDDDDKNQAFSAIKKEIERLIPAYRDQGIDVSELNKAHEDLTKEILSIRARIKAQKDALLQQLEDDKKAKERNDRALVSSINFFDRVERVRFMNAHPDFWNDAEFNAIFLNTPIEEILSEIELIGATAESLGLKAGSIVGKWNNGTNIVTPEIVVSLSYRGKKLGNLNQLDSFTVNDPSEVNLTEEQLENTVVRNTKLIALLQQKGFLSSQDLKDIGFNLSWNGDFNLDTTVSRTLVKDLPNAKLVGKSGKSFYYLYDRVNQREITDLVIDPNNELDNIPSIPDDLQERYVVLVKANNGKLYWIGTQNQVLDKQSQDSIYKYIFEQVEELKQIVDPVKYKEKVSKINRYLESTIFVASNDETKQNTQIQLTTPSGTNSKYGLRLKGVKKRIELNQATYSTMDDLLAGLDLTNVNLRVPLVNNASVSETINSLSINLTPTLFKKPSAISIKIDEDKLNSKLVDAPTAETQVVETPTEEEPEFTNQEDYDSYRLDNTEDLDEIGFIHYNNQSEPDYKVEGVKDYIGSRGKINAEDYARYGDANNLTPEIKKRFIDSTNKSSSLDTQAMELSEQLGIEVEPADFIDFVTEYSSMKGYNTKTKNKIQAKAEQRYYELTGKTLTAKRAEAGYNKIKSKSQETTTSKVNVVAVEDLSVYDPEYNNLSEDIKLQIDSEVAPLLEQLDQAKGLKKEGIRVKIRAVINKYKPDSNMPVFSIGSSQETGDYNKAVDWIKSNLPDSISIEDVEKLLANIKNNETTFGAFADNIIYLSKNLAKGTEYHEAFHAVFRLLLSDNQINIIYNKLSKTNNPTKKQLEALKNSSSAYINYTEKQLRDLYLEEVAADNFKDYGNKFNSSNPYKNVWNKIINWIRFITGNMDTLEALFYNINRGEFKKAKIVNNKFTNNISETVFQIYKKGVDNNNIPIVTSQSEGQTIVANLTKRLLQAKVNKLYPDLKDDKIIDKLLAEKASFYSIDENPYYETYLEQKGLSEDEDYIAIMSRNLEQKRNIYTLPENIKALKKDIKEKIRIFDISDEITDEERQQYIDSTGETFDIDPWTIGGETSFSKVLREYISLVTINTKDEYGQDMEEAVDFKKVYRGLVRALAGIEEDKVLPRFKALSEFDEDINAVFNQLISDLGLTNEGTLNAQDITKNYDLWRKFVTAFNNENVSWYTVLQSNEQSRLLESNTNSAKDIQFNNWLQNYNIAFEESKFDNDLRTSINKAADAINRTENIIVSSLQEAKNEAKTVVNEFKKLSINLSEAYVAYSLIKNSPYKGLDDSAKEILSAFTGVEGLYDGGNIGFIVTEFKSEFNPFLTTRDEKKKERGAVTRLKTIAAQNALFDPTIGESSFQNADGKSIYSIIRPSFGLVKLRWLRDAKTRLKLLQEEKIKKDNFIDPLESVTLNHLLANENIDIIMANLTPSMIDGYRRTKIEGDVGQTEEGEGVTFGKFNAQEYLLADMLMFLSNRKILNSIDENGRPIKLGESALFNINQMESSNTGYGVFLPVNNFTSVNQEVTDILFNYLAQEVIRINKVKNEFGKKDTVVWKGYNDSEQARGFKLMEFAGYELDDLVNSITGNNKTSEEIYAELLKNKQQIVDSIETKLEEDISQYVEVLNNNGVLGLLPKVELLKRKYLTEGKSEMTDSQKLALIYNQYLNSYINTLGINNLLLDNYAKKVKDTTDWFKRAKGIIGSGADMGAGTTRVGVYKEPLKFINVKDLSDIDRDKLIDEERLRLKESSLDEKVKKKRLSTFIKNIDKGKIQIADAQSYVTLDHKILQLKRWGRFPQQVSDIYDKLVLGKQITWEEKEILEDNNAALNSTKTVSYNGDYYFKLSEIALSPRLVGKVDENGDVIVDAMGRPLEAKEGFEYLFNKYISMLNQGVDQALPESASKMATIAPAEFAEDGNFDFTGSIMELENKFKRLQVETPSGKRHIIHGTQLIQLVNSEQEDNLPIDFKYNSDIKTLGELRALYRRLLADNRLESFKTALEYVRDPLSGEFNSIELTNKFYNTVLESGSDEVLSNFFSPNPETGERQFNWNLGPIVNKAEQLFLSHFSKGVLSQKVPGLKVSLMSDAGILIKDSVTGKMRPLAHMVKDEDGNYYSECLLPPFAEELLGRNPSDKEIQAVLKMFGIRIPTQDKHSMMSLKVVGFLPMEYGSIGIFPKEIVYLSGADFDIDSEFIHTADFFTDDAGRIRLYGTATTDENKYKEYIKWNTVNNKLLQKKLKTLSLPEALKSLNMPTTVKEFTDGKFINIGANNNAMLEAQIKFLTNDYVRERAATIPSSLTSIKEAEAIIRQALDLEEDNFVSPNSPLARFNANRSNMEGKDGIGPVALSNVVHALLSNYEQKLFSGVELPVINGKIATGFDGIFTIDSDSNRKNDNISTLLSAMTDNAKEQLAKILTLTFNPRDNKTNTLPVASYMLSIGYTMEETVLFMNQPTIRAFVTGDLSIYNKLDELDAELGKLIGYKKGTKDYERVYYKLEEEYKKPLTSENMIASLNEKDLEVYDLFHLREVSRLFGKMQLHAGYVSNISALMTLNKGVKSTFDENLRVEDVLNNLQLDFLNDFITDDINSYDELIDKLAEKDYVKVIDGKVYKNKNFPVFVIPRLVDRTPFDARETLLNDPNTIQNIIIYKKIMDVSKEFFLMNTPVFIKLRKLVKTDSKNLIPFFMNKGLENFLQNEFPEKYQSLINAKDQSGYIIHQSGDNSVGRELYKLKRDPDFRNNLLIKMLSLKSPYSSSKIVSIEFPTRIKSEGDFYVNLNNAFKELFLNPKTTEFARKLYYYSYYKDGLQFKNKSFINTIPSWVFKDVSSSLDRLNNDFKDTNYTEYTSLNEKISSSIIDMLTSMATLDNSHKYLTNLDYINYNIKKAIAVSGNINTTNIKLLPTILKQINTETKSGFIDSLKKLHKATGEDIYESLQDGIKYALSGYNENLNENTQELLSYGRVISSAKVFINDKPQILTLEELVEYFLKTNVLPVALEVTYDKIKPVRDSGFNSTINDMSFIESYKAVVKTINKKEETFKEEDKVDETKVVAVEDNNQSNLSTFVNHSGGAIGSDSEWDDIGKEFGMTNNKHYWTETQTPRGNTQISQQDFNEGKTESAKAAKRNFGYKYSVMKDSRLIRNWSQVKHSDAIFAIGKIAEIGEKLFPKQVNDTRTAITPSVQGGTGYAVGMAINNNKPVYVFNQTKSDKYDVAWYMWDSNINDFTKIDTPTLTENFAGIGTREINNEGKQAIRNVYTKTLNNIKDNTPLEVNDTPVNTEFSLKKGDAVVMNTTDNSYEVELENVYYKNGILQLVYTNVNNVTIVLKGAYKGTGKFYPSQRKIGGKPFSNISTASYLDVEIPSNNTENNIEFVNEFTPENITSLKPNEVFVFGSNGTGTHGKGAALLAKQKFGAKQGQAEGLQGQSYAVITKKDWRKEKSSSLSEIGKGLQDMLLFAKNNPNKKFFVTKLGSSLAGYTTDEIKGLFEKLINIIPNNVILPKEYEVRNLDITENNSNFVNKASEISLLDDLDLANDKDVFEKFQKIIKDSMEKDDKLNKLDSDVNEFTDDDGKPIC